MAQLFESHKINMAFVLGQRLSHFIAEALQTTEPEFSLVLGQRLSRSIG